ncbi:MAG: hypothetical protein KJI71_05580 [Patescibacteria group bacterium]|nr:hypothetical protein [Patescibacteria group bacterium]
MGKKNTQLRFRAIDRDIFEAVREGRKKVETRAATTRFVNIEPGDTVKLVCGNDSFEKQVKRVEIFKTIDELLQRYKFKEINPLVSSEKELKEMYYSFSNYQEKIRKYGLIALELE